jgi:hypothetical protein
VRLVLDSSFIERIRAGVRNARVLVRPKGLEGPEAPNRTGVGQERKLWAFTLTMANSQRMRAEAALGQKIARRCRCTKSRGGLWRIWLEKHAARSFAENLAPARHQFLESDPFRSPESARATRSKGAEGRTRPSNRDAVLQRNRPTYGRHIAGLDCPGHARPVLSFRSRRHGGRILQ